MPSDGDVAGSNPRSRASNRVISSSDNPAVAMLNWRLDYFTVWPHVKNLIPHQSIYNFGRMQEVWSDK